MPDITPPSALAALLARASVPPRLLREPGPDAAAIDLAVAAALRAPDHGGLRPCRFACVSGADRVALGGILATALAARLPDTPVERLELERAKPLRAPLVIVAGAALRHDHRIPVWEQEATAAAGTMNLLNAFEALGFGSIWLSSASLRDPAVKRALGFAESDALLGWIYLGTPAPERPRPTRPAPAAHWRHWSPEHPAA
jgi:nitroreductase